MTCVVAGSEHAGADTDAICNLFTLAITRSRRDEIRSVSISVPTGNKASAAALDGSGKTILELNFRIVDSALTLATWQDFARNFERELSVNSRQ